jgi:HEAT repeat protein
VRGWRRIALLLCLAGTGGCSRQKSTDGLLSDLKGTQQRDRLVAVRMLAHHKVDAAQVVPALIEALNDKAVDIRLSAAIGLGELGESAKEAVPALQKALADHDRRVREAASHSLSRIDPSASKVNPNSPAKK